MGRGGRSAGEVKEGDATDATGWWWAGIEIERTMICAAYHVM